MNVPMNRSISQRIGNAAVSGPRLVMAWEDWLTLAAAVVCFVSVALSIQQANWVRDFPPVLPAALTALLVGMVAGRARVTPFISHPIALVIGIVVVLLGVQSYADGFTLTERLNDTQARLHEWWGVVRSGDISNDNLPFIALVHGVMFVTAYLAAFSIFRWHTPWIAVLPGALVILANISMQRGEPSGALIFFLFGAVLLISRMHLQRSQARWKRQGVEYPDFISLSAVQLTILLTAIMLVAAWLAPIGSQTSSVGSAYDTLVSPVTNYLQRFERLFHNVDSRRGVHLHNFGPVLPIKGHVNLGTKQLYEIKAGSAGLVRGTSYDNYTGVGWRTTDRDSIRVPGGELAASPEVAEYQARNISILQVTVLDSESTLLTAGMPLGTNRDARIETPGGFRGDIEQIYARRGLRAGETYNTIGSESTATAQQLAAAGTAYPEWVTERYLQLPGDLPERVVQEAARVAGQGSPYEQAAAIQEYLRTYPFDMAVEAAPPGRDAVDFFLFELRRGYFDYHATAMAVMLRTLDIPARIAVGYVLDPEEAVETTYVVRKNDAYSWVEVFFPGYGWVVFNPTPDKPEGGAGGSFVTGGAEDLSGALDDLMLQDLFGLDPDFEGPAAVTDALTEAPVEVTPLPWTLIWSLVGAMAAVAAIVLAGRISWNWGLSGLDTRSRLWAKAHRAARLAGLSSRPSETPREWSQRMGAAIAVADPAKRLAEAYEESRYGRPDLQRIDDDEARTAYQRVRNALFSRAFRRK